MHQRKGGISRKPAADSGPEAHASLKWGDGTGKAFIKRGRKKKSMEIILFAGTFQKEIRMEIIPQGSLFQAVPVAHNLL